jgi:hypothetical protein
MMNLLESCREFPREILLFFYYPSKAYTDYLTNISQLSLVDTLDCCDISKGKDSREKLLIYKVHP